ncbi:MAG: DUF1553 domain-containing protein [Bacteroidetes bacterium]|nr:DUF1553 domain-containing protein [Bacteroidota bacterium]
MGTERKRINQSLARFTAHHHEVENLSKSPIVLTIAGIRFASIIPREKKTVLLFSKYRMHQVSFTHLAISLSVLIILVFGGCSSSVSSNSENRSRLPDVVDYNFHVQPLLSDRCYACHGPDANARQANLSLHTEEGALHAELESGGYAIVPKRLGRSEIIRRITSDDPNKIMPPPESNLTLSDYEITLIERWIQQGAEWKPHWAFTPPSMPLIPSVNDELWAQNEIDHFILARLEYEGLGASDPSDPERLIRRVTFDLTGLPPTLGEIDDFLEDPSPSAYETVVDRLLDSDAYGERMAIEWMDLSRYADSHGFHADGLRTMWPWRDWVIGAFNENMPYDEFVTWQLAGDLLPNATREQILATGFHRNHPMTAEGGVIDEEYRLEYVADRTNTTSQAFLGLTMECAKCHDHKFDPITQAEYFQLFAFFNNVNELGLTGDDGNAGPLLMLPTSEQDSLLGQINRRIETLEMALSQREQEVKDLQLDLNAEPPAHSLSLGLMSYFPFEDVEETTTVNQAPNGKDAVSGGGTLTQVNGRSGQAIRLDSDHDFLQVDDAGNFERMDPFSVSAWIRPDSSGEYARIVGNAWTKNTYWRGWEVFLDSLNHLSVRLIHALPHNYIHLQSTSPVQPQQWTHIAFTYDGSSRADGIHLYLQGQRIQSRVLYDNLYKSIHQVGADYQISNRPLRIGRRYRSFGGSDGVFIGDMDELRIYDRQVTASDIAALAGSSTDDDHLAVYLNYYDTLYRRLLGELRESRAEQLKANEEVMEVMVMEEMEEPRSTHLLERGEYDQPREEVAPGTPAILGNSMEGATPNRLGLAQWLFSPEQPLTARVTVNRYWMMLFGQGFVSTPEDFGYQGALPSHPVLLDYLAVSFMESGYDLKALIKSMVMSAAYRQSSKASPHLMEIDPSNSLLSRGPSHRMTAEMIRDNALSASGLLVQKIGGPSVKPYQPPGLWIEKGNFSHFLLRYQQDEGDALYRRSLYTFIRRTSPPPTMQVFDSPDRSTCFVRRQNTNTPLQALVLMNDPQFVEASRALAERVQREVPEDVTQQIQQSFRLATGRHPSDQEVHLLKELFTAEQERFATKPADIDSLFSVGDLIADGSLDPANTAALTIVAQIILNHDEAYTKR